VKRTPVYLLAAACAALVVAGCGGSSKKEESTQAATPTETQTAPAITNEKPSGGAAAEGGSTLQLSADPSGQLKFDKTSLSAKAGKVTLDMANPSSVPHAIGVKGNGVDKKGPTAQSQGSSSKITVDLKPGTYEFYCPVDGHEQAGMKGTLTVK
jgi:uncharacterized cupredoxin-like copper-binding protein